MGSDAVVIFYPPSPIVVREFLSGNRGKIAMKAVGFLLLLAGWLLALAAIVLFPSQPLRAVFVFAALGVEAVGLTLAFRAHLIPREEKR